MIKLHVEDYCQECSQFIPETFKTNYFDEKEGKIKPMIRVHCRNSLNCAAIKEHLEKLSKEGKK